MVDELISGSGAGGEIPPDGNPPPGAVPEGENPQDPQDILKLLRSISRQEVDQLRAESEANFAEINAKMGGISDAINQLGTMLAQQRQNTVQGTIVDVMPTAPAVNQPAVPSGPFNLGQTLASMALGLIENPAKIGEVVAGLAQVRNSFKPPTDLIAILSSIKATNPELLNLFVPDAMGGRFPELQAKAVGVGMDTMKTAMAAALKAQGIAPLVNGPLESSSVSPSSVMTQDSGSLNDLSDEALTLAMSHLMKLQMHRQVHAARVSA